MTTASSNSKLANELRQAEGWLRSCRLAARAGSAPRFDAFSIRQAKREVAYLRQKLNSNKEIPCSESPSPDPKDPTSNA